MSSTAALRVALQTYLEKLQNRNQELRSRAYSTTEYHECIVKPESHANRSYRAMTLANGLRVILAHDDSCDKAAAALAVGVGKLQEPKHIAGLAHFCEHMLFLGTAKYPKEGAYKEFIKKNGGKNNASTSDIVTCYQFDVAPDFLEPTLDMFAQFFIAPIFNQSATDREINAVDSEHSMRITNDWRRGYARLLLDANPNHPIHW